jgi:3-oxoacyl-[acyl-carrier-protein] synthase-3
MQGLEVFNFTLREEPGAIKSLMHQASVGVEELDYLVLHQANRFILTNIAKRVGVPMARVPMATLAAFGNQSSASIPFVIANELGAALGGAAKTVLASGFGVGLSWASMVGRIGPVRRCHLVDF